MNRLVGMLRTEGAWTYFITLTCNDSRTFGVTPIRRAIVKFADGDASILDQMLQDYSIILSRAWKRTVYSIWNYIANSVERPLGHVKSWMRYQFQTNSALGNRPHVHGGITIHEEPLEDTVSRVRCGHAAVWSQTCGTDYQTLLQDEIVNSDSEFSRLVDLAGILQQHSCEKAHHRCRKRKATDESFVCRVPRHRPSFEYHFEETRSPV